MQICQIDLKPRCWPI